MRKDKDIVYLQQFLRRKSNTDKQVKNTEIRLTKLIEGIAGTSIKKVHLDSVSSYCGRKNISDCTVEFRQRLEGIAKIHQTNPRDLEREASRIIQENAQLLWLMNLAENDVKIVRHLLVKDSAGPLVNDLRKLFEPFQHGADCEKCTRFHNDSYPLLYITLGAYFPGVFVYDSPASLYNKSEALRKRFERWKHNSMNSLLFSDISQQ